MHGKNMGMAVGRAAYFSFETLWNALKNGVFSSFWIFDFRFLIEDGMVERPAAENLRAVFDHSFHFFSFRLIQECCGRGLNQNC
jgi:hypothetical protein